MALISRAWRSGARLVAAVSRRTFGLEFDDLRALGCDVVRETHSQHVALTFDDGPSTYATSAVLDVLDRHAARATFFMIGANAARHAQIAREVDARGHAIGCHGHGHLDCHSLPPWRIASDLRRCKQTLEDIVGRPITSFRAPYGHFRWDVKPIAKTLGITKLVGWSVAPAYDETDPERIVRYVGDRAKGGAIVLLHDGESLEQADTYGRTRAVVSALDPMLTELGRRGLRCGTL
jgi:peptidoglycan-N-acetylglucosamine deacetylase